MNKEAGRAFAARAVSETRRCPAGSARRGMSVGSLAASAAGAGPDQAVGLAVLVVEEVGEDRGGEAGIVELQPEIVAAFAGALGPGGADLGAADEDAMAGGILAGGAGLGYDADAFGLDAEGDDVAGELVGGGLLEGADGGHGGSP
ncbi:hypothetical protein CHELA1G11_10093 [Hyphomicrobiales bacterium]|nr:hypothetical protein CHELA1G11_10093 [Hyphomicrobiales bacterium]CAH1677127.1 hypothetical protein CHELA1G2_14217 [Hyphomicrobiales bacterium]